LLSFLSISSFTENFDSGNSLVKVCDFSDVILPKNFSVYAAGDYLGLKQNIQTDQSGHEATEFTVLINVTDKPAAFKCLQTVCMANQIYAKNENCRSISKRLS
jgi:hypothetical protein